jgi:hypothetical protein
MFEEMKQRLVLEGGFGGGLVNGLFASHLSSSDKWEKQGLMVHFDDWKVARDGVTGY